MASLIDPNLLVIMICPRCGAKLSEDRQEFRLRCIEDTSHTYPVLDGIADMRIEPKEV